MSDAGRDFDVIVIGAGGAGLAAAVAAAEDGARVLVVEAAKRVGGATALSGGNILAGGTHVQAAAGVVDSADALFRHLSAINQCLPRPGIVRRYCADAPRTLLWLEGFGLRFPAEELRVTGAFGPPRAHRTAGHGAELVAALERAALARGVEFAFHTRVASLRRDATGAACGIVVSGEDIAAGAVVVASGGFGANAAKLRARYPSAARHGDWVFYIGPQGSQGDALDLAAGFDADTWGEDEGLLMLTANFSRDVEIYLPGWLVFVNEGGRRFVDETTDYAIQSFATQRQSGARCFAVFDSAALDSGRATAQDSRTAFPSPNWKPDRLRDLIGQRRIAQAETLRGLARKIGVDADALSGEIARYNAAALSGRDADFAKPARFLTPLAGPAFYAAELRPAVVAFTGAGARVDEDGRVLSRGSPTPGLFAAGEAAGGLGGALYAGNGASVGAAVVMGRIAGAAAASFARRA